MDCSGGGKAIATIESDELCRTGGWVCAQSGDEAISQVLPTDNIFLLNIQSLDTVVCESVSMGECSKCP